MWLSEQAGPKSKCRSHVCRWPGLRRGRWSLPTPAPSESESVDVMAHEPPGWQPCGRETWHFGVRGPRHVGARTLPLPQEAQSRVSSSFRPCRHGEAEATPHPIQTGLREQRAGPARTPCPPHSHLPGGSLAGADFFGCCGQNFPVSSSRAGPPRMQGPGIADPRSPACSSLLLCCPGPLERTGPTSWGMGGCFCLDAAWTAGGQPATEARPRPSRGPGCSPRPCDFPVSLQRDSARRPVVVGEYF